MLYVNFKTSRYEMFTLGIRNRALLLYRILHIKWIIVRYSITLHVTPFCSQHRSRHRICTNHMIRRQCGQMDPLQHLAVLKNHTPLSDDPSLPSLGSRPSYPYTSRLSHRSTNSHLAFEVLAGGINVCVNPTSAQR
jgi:hypothetical protein